MTDRRDVLDPGRLADEAQAHLTYPLPPDRSTPAGTTNHRRGPTVTSFESLAGVLSAAADLIQPGAVIAPADQLRQCLGVLAQAGDPAIGAFGGQVEKNAADLDEIGARLAQLQDDIRASAGRVASGGPVAG